MTKTQAVLFDIDGVLLDSAHANVSFYRALFRQAGLPIPSDPDIMAQKHLSVPAMIKEVHPEISDERLATAVALADTVTAGYEDLRLPQDVVAVVKELSTQYRLGIVTNRSRAGVEELWRFSGLKEYFSAVAAFEDTENHKPEAEPVHYALQRLQVEPRQAVFIGDALTDLGAAVAAGTKFIMFGHEAVSADVPTAQRFLDLGPLVQRLLL